jgi:hypothetical protein
MAFSSASIFDRGPTVADSGQRATSERCSIDGV